MALRNARGESVDPVPFLVVTALAFLVSFSYGPIYCMALGVSLPGALAASAGAFLACSALAYYRLVWSTHPELRGEVPAERRFQMIVYAALLFGGLLVLLTLPLLVP